MGDFAELGTPTLNLMHEVRKPKMGLRHPSVDDDQTVNEKGHKCFYQYMRAVQKFILMFHCVASIIAARCHFDR